MRNMRLLWNIVDDSTVLFCTVVVHGEMLWFCRVLAWAREKDAKIVEICKKFSRKCGVFFIIWRFPFPDEPCFISHIFIIQAFDGLSSTFPPNSYLQQHYSKRWLSCLGLHLHRIYWIVYRCYPQIDSVLSLQMQCSTEEFWFKGTEDCWVPPPLSQSSVACKWGRHSFCPEASSFCYRLEVKLLHLWPNKARGFGICHHARRRRVLVIAWSHLF
jgi:hypothetical protein